MSRIRVSEHEGVAANSTWFDRETGERIDVEYLRRHPVTFRLSVVYRRGGGLQRSSTWLSDFHSRYTR